MKMQLEYIAGTARYKPIIIVDNVIDKDVRQWVFEVMKYTKQLGVGVLRMIKNNEIDGLREIGFNVRFIE